MPKRYADGLAWPVPHEAMRYAGYRAMRQMAATRPESTAYGAYGMYLFSHAVWLAEEMRRGGFDRLIFLARDGYHVKAAFDRIRDALDLHVETDYVRISRQAAFPLHFRAAEDLAQLPDWVDVAAHTPQTMTALLAPVLDMDRAQSAMEVAGLSWVQRLTEQTLPDFTGVCRNLWDAQGAAAYREHARAYLAPRFAGKCAAFDVGYNLRSEAVIRDLTDADITAFITHTDSDVPDRRNVPYRTLYGRSPWVSWVAREQFLLEDAPLCMGYDAQGPVLSETHPPVSPAIRSWQKAAMDFVDDMVSAYGSELAQMPFRPQDGCAAFEHFLHCASRRDMVPFRSSGFENAFHAGAAGEDSAFLQWRLMQADFRAAMGEGRWINRLRRAMIRLREDPQSFFARLKRFASE